MAARIGTTPSTCGCAPSAASWSSPAMLRFDFKKIAIPSLLVGSLLVGLSFAALLPPFEGFDETAHYSYIEPVGRQRRGGRRPHVHTSAIDAVPVRHRAAAMTDRSFFAAPPDVMPALRAAARSPRIHRARGDRRGDRHLGGTTTASVYAVWPPHSRFRQAGACKGSYFCCARSPTSSRGSACVSSLSRPAWQFDPPQGHGARLQLR